MLGCTGFAGFAEKISGKLEKDGYRVPVIDPAAASLKMIEALVTCNVKNSNVSYLKPIEKKYILPRKDR